VRTNTRYTHVHFGCRTKGQCNRYVNWDALAGRAKTPINVSDCIQDAFIRHPSITPEQWAQKLQEIATDAISYTPTEPSKTLVHNKVINHLRDKVHKAQAQLRKAEDVRAQIQAEEIAATEIAEEKANKKRKRVKGEGKADGASKKQRVL